MSAGPDSKAPGPGAGNGGKVRNVTIQEHPTMIHEGDGPEGRRVVRQYRYPSGDVYTGEWKENRKHGRGVAQYASGHRYEGEWRDDKKDGQGTFVYDQGTSYTGQWKEDMKHGHGIALFASGNRYEGEWENDNMHGQGTFVYGTSGGDTYSGSWQHGKMSGFGTWTSGQYTARYVGEWRDGVRHGRGVLLSHGRTLNILYDNGHVAQQELAATPIVLQNVPAIIHTVVDLQTTGGITATTQSVTLQSGEVLPFDDIVTLDRNHQGTLERIIKDLLAGFDCMVVAFSPTADFLTGLSSRITTGFMSLLLHGLKKQDASSKGFGYSHEGVVLLEMAALGATGTVHDLLDLGSTNPLAMEDTRRIISGLRSEVVRTPVELQALQAKASTICSDPGCMRIMQFTIKRRLLPRNASAPVLTLDVHAVLLDVPASDPLPFSPNPALVSEHNNSEPLLCLNQWIISGNNKATIVAVVPPDMSSISQDQVLQHVSQFHMVQKTVTPSQLLPVAQFVSPASIAVADPTPCAITVQPPTPNKEADLALLLGSPCSNANATNAASSDPPPVMSDAAVPLGDSTHDSSPPPAVTDTPCKPSLPATPGLLDLIDFSTELSHQLSDPLFPADLVPKAEDLTPDLPLPPEDPFLNQLRQSGFVARRILEFDHPNIMVDPQRDAPYDTCLGQPLLSKAPDQEKEVFVDPAYVKKLQQQVLALQQLVVQMQLRQQAEQRIVRADMDFLLRMLSPSQLCTLNSCGGSQSSGSTKVSPNKRHSPQQMSQSPNRSGGVPNGAHLQSMHGHLDNNVCADSSDESDSSGPTHPQAPPNSHPFLQQLAEMGFSRLALSALLQSGPPLTNTDAVFEWLQKFSAQIGPGPDPEVPPPAMSKPAPQTARERVEQWLRLYQDPTSGPYPLGTNMPNASCLKMDSDGPTLVRASTDATSSFGADDIGDDKLNSGAKEDGLPVCGICFEPFRMRGFILCCDHLFCYTCIQKWARNKRTCPHCARTFTEVYRSPVQIGELTEAQEKFLVALQEMGYLEQDIQALRQVGPHLDQHDLVFRWLAEYRQNVERKAMREAAERASQPKSVPTLLSFARSTSAGDARSPKFLRKAFEIELERILQMEVGTQQYWNAMNQMVEWLNAKALPPKEALKILKVPLKSGPLQLQALNVLEIFVSNCNIAFALEVATRKWMERLLKILKESRDRQINTKVMCMLFDWERRFTSDQRFHEFSSAASKLRHKL